MIGKYILILFIFILDINNQLTMEKQLKIEAEERVKKMKVILNKKKKRMEDSIKAVNRKKIERIEEEKNLINKEIKKKKREIEELTAELTGKDEEKKNIQEGEANQLIEIEKEIEKKSNNYLLDLMEDIEIEKILKGFKKKLINIKS